MELIITEKPSSAEKIAKAIADTTPSKKVANKVTYWELTSKGKPVVVVSAVGHLYTVAEKKKNGWTYPVFDVTWVPAADVNKKASYSRKYLSLIKKLASKADEITIATDFDIEGEVIGYTILKYAIKKEDANRMKYSTVTKEDLQKSYDSKAPHIEHGQAKAGVTRHELDWYYGINLSRALTSAIQKAGRFTILSSGRVQTPALKILADKEKEIQAFVSEPYWEVELITPQLTAKHEKGRFDTLEEAQEAKNNSSTVAVVDEVQKKNFAVPPPHPFDLTTLQIESYRSLRMKPKETQQHAQDLYSAGYISYPRTSSQQLPPDIGYEKILKQLSKQKEYSELAGKLIGKKLRPNNGKKTDPAHPAIYPTGIVPAKISDRARKVYDLIVRRFMATFAESAQRQTLTIRLLSGSERYQTKGTITLKQGWYEYYAHHVKQKEEELPELKQGDELEVIDVRIDEKQTQPPKRYTPSSIIKELEKRGLGTKATRSEIIEHLYDRGYIKDDSITVTEIGMRTVNTLEKYVPEILDEKLTRQIESELEAIREGKIQPEEVLSHAKDHIIKTLQNFDKNKEKIGSELLKATQETINQATILGACPACKAGELQIKRGKYGLFVGCTNYPECSQTYKLPKANIKPANKVCEHCSTPMILLKRPRKKEEAICINPNCNSKELTSEADKIRQQVENEGVSCPDCGKPLKVRKSAYGTFIGCSAYPKCKYIQQLESKNI